MTASPSPATARLAHDLAQGLWSEHVVMCPLCLAGARCRVADDLASMADSAGLRWERAESLIAIPEPSDGRPTAPLRPSAESDATQHATPPRG